MKSKEELLKQLDELASLVKSKKLNKLDPATHLPGTFVDKSEIKKDAFGPTTQSALNSISSAFGSKPATPPPPPPPPPPTSSSGAIKSMRKTNLKKDAPLPNSPSALANLSGGFNNATANGLGTPKVPDTTQKSMDNSPGKRWNNDHDMVNRIKEIYGVSKGDEKSISANNNPTPGAEVAKSGSSPDQKSGNGELSEPVEKAKGGKAQASDFLDQKGVHIGQPDRKTAGTYQRMSTSPAGHSVKAGNIKGAKQQHKKVLGELKAQPKPNLPKSEEMGKSGYRQPGEKGIHGTHQPTSMPGTSRAGAIARTKFGQSAHHAKQEHKKVLGELKAQPKPNLPKSEAGENDLQKKSLKSSPDQKSGNGDLDKIETLKKPYVSDAQRRWAHTNKGTKALGGKAQVEEWDQSSKGRKLPERVGKTEEIKKKYEGFKEVEEKAKESGARDPGAVAASIGRKKYGKKAFQAAAAAGHKMKKAEDPICNIIETLSKSQKGIHTSGPGQGSSSAGLMARGSDKNLTQAKTAHKKVLNEIKDQKKPNLPKSELDKAQEKGVHPEEYSHDKQGRSDAGGALRTVKGWSGKRKAEAMGEIKDEHKKKLGELKSMPKPNLPKSEAGSSDLKKDSAKENPIYDGIATGSTTNLLGRTEKALSANENDPVLNILGRLKKGFFLG